MKNRMKKAPFSYNGKNEVALTLLLEHTDGALAASND